MSYKQIKAGWDREPESEKRKIKRTVGGYLFWIAVAVGVSVFSLDQFCQIANCRGW